MVSLFPKYTSLTKLTKSIFKLGGLTDLEGKSWIILYMAYQRFILHISFIITVSDTIVRGKEINHIISSLSPALVTILAAFKFYVFVARKHKIFNILDRLEDTKQKMLQTEESAHLVKEAENFGKKVQLGLILMYLGIPTVSFTLNTVAEIMTNFSRKNNVAKIWFPWSRENNLVHVLSNGLITLMAFSVRCVFIGCYSMEITFTLYVSAYIKTIQNYVINKGIRNEGIYEHHKVIIQLIKDYNETLSGQMYLEILISPLIPCGFALSFIRGIQKRDIGKTFASSLITLAYLMSCFISCCCGQEVVNQMEKLHEVTFMSNWYEEKPKIRKDFLIMKIQTTKQTSINYRLFVKFDNVLLLSVLQVIYSYFMLLINMDIQ